MQGTMLEAMDDHDFVFRNPMQQDPGRITKEGVCACCDARMVMQMDTEVGRINWAYICWRNGQKSQWSTVDRYPTVEEARQWAQSEPART